MKKSKGFTIPELLVVIAILGILVTMATASYNGISNNIKKKTLDNKINLIKIKAEEYATDNDIVTDTISVAKLINEGYLDSEADTDNNERISNPLGGYLDCYRINIDKGTDEYDISVDEDTSCEIANMDNAADKIEISVYEGENNRITNYNPLNVTLKSSETKWTNKDVYLFINPDTIEGNVQKITWLFNGAEYPKENVNMATTVNTDTDTYANIFKVSSVLLLNTYTYAKIETDAGVLSKRVSVRIDKEAPSVTLDTNYRYEAVDDATKKSLKTVNFTGSDGSGSGIDSNYVVVPDNIDTSVAGEYIVTYTVFDKVGNYTEKQRKIIVMDIKGKTYYRYRTATYENYQCDAYMCNCVKSESAKLTLTCPSGYTFNEPDKCCQTCYKTCKRTVWSEWSEWTQEKVSATSTREVETKIE